MKACPALASLLLLVSCSALADGPQYADSTYKSSVALYVGQRTLDDDEYEPLEDQLTFGVEYVGAPANWAVGYEVGLMLSEDDGDFMGIDIEAETQELYAGVRQDFGEAESPIRPYVGVGLTLIEATVRAGTASDDDATLAPYLHGGVAYVLQGGLSLGLDVRTVFASDLTLASIDTDADYVQVALTVGYSF